MLKNSGVTNVSSLNLFLRREVNQLWISKTEFFIAPSAERLNFQQSLLIVHQRFFNDDPKNVQTLEHQHTIVPVDLCEEECFETSNVSTFKVPGFRDQTINISNPPIHRCKN
ncbi:MAG: hypothetical protein IPI90_15775 [Saprospiraceae bacterium]|nr:hypothetical protein [Candidatus Vicinibacter affinis]